MLIQNHRLPVTDEGVFIPKGWLGAATEVTVRRENGRIVVDPVFRTATEPTKDEPRGYDPNDPIWSWGSDPIDIGITDGSVNLDEYVYGDPHGTGE